MIKLILCGFWVCVVTLLSTYGVIAWYGAAATAAAPAPRHMLQLPPPERRQAQVRA